jgi:hypothetical protein
METQLPKFTYYKDEDFILEYQVFERQMNLHCIVNNWNKTSLRKGYSVFKTLQEEARDTGVIDNLFTITPNPKFAKLFGGEKVSEINYNDIKHEVIVWVLKPQQLLPSLPQ